MHCEYTMHACSFIVSNRHVACKDMYSYVCFDLYLQEPIEVNIGEPYYVTKLVGKRRRKVLTQDSIVYIPIAKTLKSLLTYIRYTCCY